MQINNTIGRFFSIVKIVHASLYFVSLCHTKGIFFVPLTKKNANIFLFGPYKRRKNALPKRKFYLSQHKPTSTSLIGENDFKKFLILLF